MLLVQNVTDDKRADQDMVDAAVSRFLKGGGKIQKVGMVRRDESGMFGGEARRAAANARARADLHAKMKANMPAIIDKHRAKMRLSTLAKHYRTSPATIKRYLFDAGENPAANVKNPAVSLEQIIAIQSMVEGGSSRADIERWTGLTGALVQQTIHEYEFKYLE